MDPVSVDVRGGTEEVDSVIVEVRGGREEVDSVMGGQRGAGRRWGTGYAGGVRASLPRPGTLLLLSRLLPLTRPCGTGGFRACSGCSAAGVVGYISSQS